MCINVTLLYIQSINLRIGCIAISKSILIRSCISLLKIINARHLYFYFFYKTSFYSSKNLRHSLSFFTCFQIEFFWTTPILFILTWCSFKYSVFITCDLNGNTYFALRACSFVLQHWFHIDAQFYAHCGDVTLASDVPGNAAPSARYPIRL